jgi:hypothetical protein
MVGVETTKRRNQSRRRVQSVRAVVRLEVAAAVSCRMVELVGRTSEWAAPTTLDQPRRRSQRVRRSGSGRCVGRAGGDRLAKPISRSHHCSRGIADDLSTLLTRPQWLLPVVGPIPAIVAGWPSLS